MTEYSEKTMLLKILADAGIRPSIQRLEILEFIFSCKCHPTADEIYMHLARTNPTLSRTTVFSNVKLLAEKGLVNDINISADSTRYDSAQQPRHAHFICRNCKNIFDIQLDMDALAALDGFTCDNVNVFFKGICPECKKNEQIV